MGWEVTQNPRGEERNDQFVSLFLVFLVHPIFFSELENQEFNDINVNSKKKSPKP